MRKEGAIRVAVVGGIPIYIHWSFGLLIAWIILSALCGVAVTFSGGAGGKCNPA